MHEAEPRTISEVGTAGPYVNSMPVLICVSDQISGKKLRHVRVLYLFFDFKITL